MRNSTGSLLFVIAVCLLASQVVSRFDVGNVGSSLVDSCLCTSQRPSGMFEDGCCCSGDSVEEHVNNLLPTLDDLVNKQPLRYFRINLDATCPFWDKPETCAIRACAVCECPPDEVPTLIRQADDQCVCEALDPVDRTAASAPGDAIPAANEHVWAVGGALSEGSYIDLSLNPEQYTAYLGPHIWEAIYAENCFPDRDACLETRVFYRVVSGLHASINSHLSYHHGREGILTPNVTLYQERVGRYPERIQNLYFTYTLMLRAVARAADVLLTAELKSGNETEDEETMQLLQHILDSNLQNCPLTFDESQLFQGPQGHLRDAFRQRFVNISRIMDCVGCERCQLWGKVQTLGVGTALKLLFCEDYTIPECRPTRNEAVALLNTLRQLAESISILQRVRKLEAQQELHNMKAAAGHPVITVAAVVVVVLLVFWRVRTRSKAQVKVE